MSACIRQDKRGFVQARTRTLVIPGPGQNVTRAAGRGGRRRGDPWPPARAAPAPPALPPRCGGGRGGQRDADQEACSDEVVGDEVEQVLVARPTELEEIGDVLAAVPKDAELL